MNGRTRVHSALRLLACGTIRRLLAERELQAAVLSFQPCRLERPLEPTCITLQQLKRFRPVDGEARADLAAFADIETHINASEFRRIEADVELTRTFLGTRGDLDGNRGSRERYR